MFFVEVPNRETSLNSPDSQGKLEMEFVGILNDQMAGGSHVSSIHPGLTLVKGRVDGSCSFAMNGGVEIIRLL